MRREDEDVEEGSVRWQSGEETVSEDEDPVVAAAKAGYIPDPTGKLYFNDTYDIEGHAVDETSGLQFPSRRALEHYRERHADQVWGVDGDLPEDGPRMVWAGGRTRHKVAVYRKNGIHQQ